MALTIGSGLILEIPFPTIWRAEYRVFNGGHGTCVTTGWTLPDFNPGEADFEVSHSLLVDRLQYLPNNTIEGSQVILVRAISGAESSTNLATAIYIVGEEKAQESGGGGFYGSSYLRSSVIHGNSPFGRPCRSWVTVG